MERSNGWYQLMSSSLDVSLTLIYMVVGWMTDREYFASDTAAELYPASAYYLAQMLVELVVSQ